MTSIANEVAVQSSAAEKVKSSVPAQKKKQALRTAPKLHRETFITSREMDFFSRKELVTQTGHEIGEWPLVFVKETIDNALDACEEAGVAPVIGITADGSGIAVCDNGPGLPEDTLRAALDFTVRASNREAYVSPCRGAQGNALKTLLPMARVVDQESGRLIVASHGKRHVINCGACPITQRAAINDESSDHPPSLSGGTEIRMEWSPHNGASGVVWPFDSLSPRKQNFSERFRSLIEGFALFNPHATIRLDWFGQAIEWQSTQAEWDKWRPDKPTSPHWYESRHLDRLIGAYIGRDRDRGEDRLVSELLAEFDGLSGSRNRTKVLDEAELKRAKLSELVVDGRLDSARIAKLLTAMQRHTRPVKPNRLGFIGEEHLKARFLEMGVKEESFNYKRKVGPPKSKNLTPETGDKASFVPWVLESAFGWLGDGANDSRKIYAGANWSAAIKNPFRSFGSTGEGLEAALTEMRAGRTEPIVFVLHLAHPRVEYTDRGKSALIIGGAS